MMAPSLAFGFEDADEGWAKESGGRYLFTVYESFLRNRFLS
jgi:hypothetical protein